MIKKFHAGTTREALRMVRDALGANAIILSNRQVAGGVEIIAVADLDVAALSSQAEPVGGATGSAPRSDLPPAYPQGAGRILSAAEAATAALRAQSLSGRPGDRQERPAAAETVAHRVPPAGRPAVTPLTEYIAQREASIIRPVRGEPVIKEEASAASRQPAAAADAAAGEVPASAAAARQGLEESGQAVDELTREVRLLRNLVEGQLAGFAWGEIAGREPLRAEVMRRLLSAGFSPALSRQLLEKLPKGADLERALRWLKSAIIHNIKTVDEAVGIVERGGVYALVGPTGVGKTTTVAKLAARAVLRHGPAKVALVTTDTYRIGAQDQLRIYGRILGIPVFAVQDQDDLDMTLADLGRKHLVLIDTVGMNQRDKRVAEQVALLCGEARGVKRLLLLGAPAQGLTLEEVARAYSGPGLIGCILTKIDEALSYGPSLDVVMRHQLPVHYVTNGQRVPEDLHPANALYLVDRAFRLALADTPYTPGEGDYPVLMAAMERSHIPGEYADPGIAGIPG